MIHQLFTSMAGIGLAVALMVAAPLAETAPKLDLNTATAQQLESLPGIGPAMALRIVQFRSENGPFKRIEDLLNVRGIGEKKFLQLKDRVTVGPAPVRENPAGKSS